MMASKSQKGTKMLKAKLIYFYNWSVQAQNPHNGNKIIIVLISEEKCVTTNMLKAKVYY